MDVIYTYRHNQKDYAEWPALRHSINSVRRFYSDLDQIYLVTEPMLETDSPKPWIDECDWDDVVYCQQAPEDFTIETKARNIINSLCWAIRELGVHGNFLWMCDDFYMIRSVSTTDFLSHRYEPDGAIHDYPFHSPIAKLVRDTLEMFPKDRSIHNYMCHHPVRLNGPHLLKLTAEMGPVYQLETLHCNSLIEFAPLERTPDYSVFAWDDDVSTVTPKTRFLSHAEFAGPNVRKLLSERIYG